MHFYGSLGFDYFSETQHIYKSQNTDGFDFLRSDRSHPIIIASIGAIYNVMVHNLIGGCLITWRVLNLYFYVWKWFRILWFHWHSTAIRMKNFYIWSISVWCNHFFYTIKELILKIIIEELSWWKAPELVYEWCLNYIYKWQRYFKNFCNRSSTAQNPNNLRMN